MKNNRLTIILLLCQFLFACGDDGGGSPAVPSASSISEGDFVATAATPIDAAQLESELQFSDYLVFDSDLPNNLMAAAGMAFALSIACPNLIPDPVFQKNSDNTFVYEFAFDAKACLDTIDPATMDLPVNTNEQVNSFIISAQIDNLIFEDQLGNTVDVSGMGMFSTIFLRPVQFTLKTLMSIESTSGSFTTKTMVSDSNDSSGPCIFGDNQLDACTVRERNETRALGFANVDIQTYHYNNVIYPATDLTPFDGGTIDFSINDWDGSVSYGANIIPSYEATNGINLVTGSL